MDSLYNAFDVNMEENIGGNTDYTITVSLNTELGTLSEIIPVPEKIIYNGTTTICVFPDGEKITARPTNEDNFDKEVGVSMCIMKRIFGSRSAFLRVVESGYDQNNSK